MSKLSKVKERDGRQRKREEVLATYYTNQYFYLYILQSTIIIYTRVLLSHPNNLNVCTVLYCYIYCPLHKSTTTIVYCVHVDNLGGASMM